MDARRALPAVHRLVAALPDLPHPLVVACARGLLDEVRAGAEPPDDWAIAVRMRVTSAQRLRARRVINATGVVLHTNLGRAPLSAEVAAAVAHLAQGYTDLELDLETGARGERLNGVRGLLTELTGAEDAVAVNNNAAAVLLALSAIAAGREVIVSRGELVEIGGAFRVPEVIAQGGARLVEVGTTNRTRLSDYAAAIGPATAAILRVHPSNFRIAGFTEAPDRAELHALARTHGVPLIEDWGSGALAPGLGERTVAEVCADADLVCFSGDKLMGGPQAGVAVGSATLVRSLRRHPLYRALRLDRLVLTALEATLLGYRAGVMPPAVEMMRLKPEELRRRAHSLAGRLVALGLDAKMVADEGRAGGGTLPEEALEGFSVALRVASAERFAVALRRGDPPVVARVTQDTVRLDPRTVAPSEEEALIAACAAVHKG